MRIILFFLAVLVFGVAYPQQQMFLTGQAQDLLLDTYSGASFAYGLRKLNSSYTGAAIEVQRDSDGDSLDIVFTIGGEIDTVSLVSFCAGTDCQLLTWYDQSGNGNDLRNATSFYPELYRADTLVTVNGKAAIGRNTAGRSILENNVSGVTVKTIFAVANITDASTARRIMASYPGTGGVGPDDMIFDGFGGNLRYFDGGKSVSVSGLPDGQGLYYAMRSSNIEAAINGGGVVSASGANATANTLDYTVMEDNGGVNEQTLFLQEIIFYDSDQSANRSAIESKINSYFSIY